MEVNTPVWLRRPQSQWGWEPALIVEKEEKETSKVAMIHLTLELEATGELVHIPLDPSEALTADCEDIKLRNTSSSFQWSGEDPEAHVVASPSTHTQPQIVGGVDDLIGLTHLHEPAILHALRLRYNANIIYTATGPILIAVNPFRSMGDLYSSRSMESYRRQGEMLSSNSGLTSPLKRTSAKSPDSKLAPHVYQTADDAYRQMLRGLENRTLLQNSKGVHTSPSNQSILVSGESGAGKTVTTKIVLEYLAMLSNHRGTVQSHSNQTRVSIEQQVLQSNPILEAFGNARTIRNDNSSRFGKYIDIAFSSQGKLSGASIETYLLEKVRLIHPSPGERNYHVFYQFLKAASAKERQDFFLGSKICRDFRLLSDSGTYDRRDGVSDEESHLEMMRAMITIGFENETIRSLMRIVSALLFAGNMSFTPSQDMESCKLDKTKPALACAALLGITFDGLATALTSRAINAADETVTKPLTIEEAGKACEALIKAVYGASFDFIVEQVNASITTSSVEQNDASIGVLDIFGFETFQTNSFEQICINYTNEALQQQFNRYVFKLEQQEYEKEGILWKFISFPDNQDVLDLIDMKHTGIMALLDEQCILPRSTDQKFTRYLYARCDAHPRFSATSAQRVDYLFSIEHYAGLVEYTTDGWLEKNKDQLPAASSELLQSSDFDLLLNINRFIRTEDRGGRGTVATKSVSSQFSSQLRVLRSRIETTIPHYIRCLKPNDELVPNKFDPKNIVEQLRCGGVLEAVRVSRAGYPTRYPHAVFLARYYTLAEKGDTNLTRLIGKIAQDLWETDHTLLQAELSTDESYNRNSISKKHSERAGVQKVKMHSGHGARNDFNLVVESSIMTPEFQRKRRAKKSTVMRPESLEEFLSLDYSSRCAVAGLQLGRTKVFLRREAFDRIEGLRSAKFFQAASVIQKIVRGNQARQEFKILKRIHRAALTIQCAWRVFCSRMYVFELQLARRTAAMIIQRVYRDYKRVDASPVIPQIDQTKNDLVQLPSPAKIPSPTRSAIMERDVSPKQSNEILQYVDGARLEELFHEIQEENWAMVENILDKHPELAEQADMKTGELALHKISRHSGAWTLLIDMVLVLYPKGLIHRDNMGALPIHHASAHDNLSALEIVFSAYKEGINDTDKMGRLPIHVAANYDAIDAIKFLLTKSPEGAYTMVYRPPHNSGGGLPLHIACRNHASIGVITALLAENFASAKRTDENGDLPLHLLLRCGEVVDPVVVKTLLTCFAGALNRTDMNGDLPLHIAIKFQCSSAVINSILMQYSEAAGILNGQSHSALHLAFLHNADDRTLVGLLNHAPELAAQVDKESGLLPIQVATENEHSQFIVHNLLKRDMPIDMKEKVRAQLLPHRYSWNHVVANTEDLYHQVVTKVLQSCTQPQVLALAHIEGPDGKIALATATPVSKHEMRVMLRLFNTLEVVNQRPAYTNPISDTQIFYALRYNPPPQSGSGAYTVLHEEKRDGADDYVEDWDDNSHVSNLSKTSLKSTLTSRSQQSIEDKLRRIRNEKGQQVIAKLTSRSDIVENELKIRKDFHLSRHYVPAIISVHHTVQHAAYSEAMAEPGYCITMEGADTTAENLMLDIRKHGRAFPDKALKRIGISLLHMHEHGIIHGDFGTHNIGKFGSRWKLLGVGGSTPMGRPTNPNRGFYHPPEAIVVENKRSMSKKGLSASVVSIPAHSTYDIWAYGVVLYEALAGLPLGPYACRGKRAMSASEVCKIGLWDEASLRKALRHVPEKTLARDLLKRLLHHDPSKRINSMRHVLEHPFFASGSVGGNGLGDRTSPNDKKNSTPASNESRNDIGKSNDQSDRRGDPPQWQQQFNAFPEMDIVKQSNSSESLENIENGVRRQSKGEDLESVKSGRSFGGFRKLRTLRKPTVT